MSFKARIQEIDGEAVLLFPEEVIKEYGLEEGDELLVKVTGKNRLLTGICEKKK